MITGIVKPAALLWVAFVLLCACTPQNPVGVVETAASPTGPTSTQECPTVDSLDVSAFQGIAAGACVILVPPASSKPEKALWCPEGAILPRGNTLMVIGKINTLIRREGEEFAVAGPDANGEFTFRPLIRKGNALTLNGEVELFRLRAEGGYECLVPTIVGQPE